MALLSGKLDQVDDPEILLFQAQREMIEWHERNRERAVHAITHKNHRQQMMNDPQARISRLEAEANLALESGDTEKARQLLDEKLRYERTLTITQQNLDEAIKTVEEVKAAIRREEEQIRRIWTERRKRTPLGGSAWLPQRDIAPLPGWFLFLTILSVLIFLSLAR